MEKSKKIIKDDMNFLEYPNWIIDRKNNATSWLVDKPNGSYKIMSVYGMPKHFDKIVLYYLLYRINNNKNMYEITTSRYEIAKSVYPGVKDFGKNKYARILLALKKWTALTIEFKGLFYEGDEYTQRSFHIIDEYTLSSKGQLKVKLNESYVTQLRQTKFYKMIDFDQYKKLHKSSSARLYEILAKSFGSGKEWTIGIQLLAEKLTLSKQDNAKKYYPSDALRYIKPAVNEINKKTDMSIGFKYNKETGVCLFKKLPKSKPAYTPAVRDKSTPKASDKERDSYLKEFYALPQEEQEMILNSIRNNSFLDVLPDEETKIYSYMRSARSLDRQ